MTVVFIGISALFFWGGLTYPSKTEVIWAQEMFFRKRGDHEPGKAENIKTRKIVAS